MDNVIGSLQTEFPKQTVIYVKTDVASRENVRKSFRQVNDKFGHIDVVIGNAGIFDETQPETMIKINLVRSSNTTFGFF